MKDMVKNLTEHFRREHRRARRYTAMMLVLALSMTLFVNWQLHGVGISMTADYQCGMEEHEHTAECYKKVLICGYEEGEPEDPNASALPGEEEPDAAFGVTPDPEPEIAAQSEPAVHHHTDECYEEEQVLTCREEEHEHTDDCFDEEGRLICDIIPHTHTEDCYTTERKLVCGKEEGEPEEPEQTVDTVQPQAAVTLPLADESRPVVTDPPQDAVPVHHHTEDCYREELVCTIPEHHHTVECLSDPLADVETEADWLARTDTTLSGNWGEDLLRVAQSQLDYQESTRNFKLDVEEEEQVRGWSRYGAWYGNPYGEWDVMFLSYCLHYADVPQSVIPQRAGVMALRSDLHGSAWLLDGSATPQVGDIVIYENTSGTETVGIVEAAEENTLTVISGDVEGAVARVTVSSASVTGVISVTDAYAAQAVVADPDTDQTPDANPDAGVDSEPDQPEEGTEVLPEDEDFQVVVSWEKDETAKLDPMFAVAAQSSLPPVNLEDHITSVTMKKDVDGVQTEITSGDEVKDGETIYVDAAFSFAAGVLTAERNVATYQLPGGLRLKTAIRNGIIKNGRGEMIGSYTISLDGLVTMTFDTDGIGGSHDGTLSFTATADYRDAQDGSLTINNRFTLNITKPDPDLSIKKGLQGNAQHGNSNRWSDAEGNQYLQWYVEASSTKGTDGQTVTIRDELNVNNSLLTAYFDETSFVLEKRAADGTTTVLDMNDYTVDLDNDADLKYIQISDLPALKDGETYRLEYVVKIPPESFEGLNIKYVMYNTASANAGDLHKQLSKPEQITFEQKLAKSGRLNAEGLVEWTITVKAPKDVTGGFLSGYKLTDTLPPNATLVGNVRITPSSGSAWTISGAELESGYTLSDRYPDPSTMPHTFTITYKTTAIPDNGNRVTNTATLTKNGVDYTVTASVPVTAGVWTVSKSHVRTVNDVAYWNVGATNATGATDFVLTDTIGKTTDSTGQTVTLENAHYAIASELQSAIESGLELYQLHQTTAVSYAQAKSNGWLAEDAIHYYDANGNPVPPTDAVTPVMMFTIKVQVGENDTVVRRMALNNLPTHEARGEMQSGDQWTFRNIAEAGGTEVTASDTYKCYRRFEKMVATDSGRTNYTTANGTVALKDLAGGKLRYRIVMSTSADERDTITVTDKLPEGGKITSNVFYQDGVQLSGGTYRAVVNGDTLTLTISNYNTTTPGQAHTIEYLYDLDISGDPAWANPGTAQASYTNEAVWGKEKASITTIVTRDVEPLVKTGTQLKEDNGDWSNKIRYTVLINPGKETLGDGTWLTLKDKAIVPEGASFYGDLSTVKLYYYEYGSTTRREVPTDLYKKLDSDGECWLILQVPDRTALQLEYVGTIDRGSYTSPVISNTISLNDKPGKSESNIGFETNDSQATLTRGELVINKTDRENGSLLPGAEFELQQYNKDTKSFAPCKTGTTGENGQLIFEITSNAADTLRPDTLYRLVETNAPQNYIRDETPRYLLFYSKDSTPEDSFLAATGETNQLTVTMADGTTETINKDTNLTVGSAQTTTMLEVKNTYNQLTVRKYWFNKDTNMPLDAADIPVDALTVELWRYTEGQTPADAVRVENSQKTLTAENDWSATWEGQALSDENGKAYYYLAKEVTTGSWTVEGENEGGTRLGVIVLRNYVYEGYRLPSTGGTGTAPFLLGGALLMSAAVLLYRRRKRADKAQEKE